MSPSSPVSVGTFLSNRTPLVGVKQVDLDLERIKLEQFPLTSDPFLPSESVSRGMKYDPGKTEQFLIIVCYLAYS